MLLRDLFIHKSPDPEMFPKYRPQDYAFLPARLTDNPYLDPEYVHRLEQLPDARQRQLRDGDWDVFASQFFPEWRAERDGQPWHVADLDEEAGDSPLYGGVDWGYNQPGCFGWYRALPDGLEVSRAERRSGCGRDSRAHEGLGIGSLPRDLLRPVDGKQDRLRAAGAGGGRESRGSVRAAWAADDSL